jgi:hypothetical protein
MGDEGSGGEARDPDDRKRDADDRGEVVLQVQRRWSGWTRRRSVVRVGDAIGDDETAHAEVTYVTSCA